MTRSRPFLPERGAQRMGSDLEKPTRRNPYAARDVSSSAGRLRCLGPEASDGSLRIDVSLSPLRMRCRGPELSDGRLRKDRSIMMRATP